MGVKKEMRAVTFFFILFVVCIADDQLDGGYILTCQRSIKLGENNQCEICRYGKLSESDFVTLSLYYSESYNGNKTLLDEKEYRLGEGKQCSLLDFPVKLLDIANVYNGVLQIEGEIDGECISGSDKVTFVIVKQFIYIIQTDKPFYKAGDIVKFRVLKVDSQLRPPIYEDDFEDFAEIFIEDTKRTRLFQFNRVNLAQGIVQLEFPLSDEPALGDWRITVVNNNVTKSETFEVKEYVLPKFDVTIKFPPYVLANAYNFSVTVCANYTYGKPVQGELKLNISLETYYYLREKTPVLQEFFEINGCRTYIVNVSKIELDGFGYRRIQVVASVTEKGTGVQRNKTAFLQRQYQPLNLNFNIEQNYRQYFKPGLPYNGELKVTYPDDSPANGEACEICYTVSRVRIIFEWLAKREVKFCSNFTSNEKGIIKYIIPPQSTDAESIRLEAKSLKYARNQQNSGSRQDSLNQPTAGMTLSSFYSPSGSFIQLETVGGVITCGSVQEFKFLYTAKQSEDESFNFKLRYEIRRQGNVVQTGYKDVNFNMDVSKKFENEDELIDDSETQIVPAPKSTSSSNSGSSDNDDENCQVAKEVKYIPPIGEASIPIEITPELSPSFILLIYYVRDDRETVADSQKIEVEKCFKNKVDFEFGDEVKQPGTKTSITVTSSPNSLCGLRVVDKSVSLLDSNNQLTKEKIFQLLESFDIGNYYSDNPCNEKIPQPGLYAAKSAGIILPPPGRWRSSSYQDSLTAFVNAGLLVISNLILFSRPCTSGGGYTIYPEAESFSVNKVRSKKKGHAVALASTARRPAAPAMGAGAFAADAKSGMAELATKSVGDRTYFPETWLFDLRATGPDGVYITKETLPDTITEWEGSAVCVNAEDGLGLSNTTTIKGFQAFFISLTLPYSVIRGEIITIPVNIFNYVKYALPITVSLADSDEYEVIGESVNRDICIQPDTSKIINVQVKPVKVGKVNITVRAETSDSNQACGDSPVYDGGLAKDVITQSFKCEPEGYPGEKVESQLFCPTDEEDETFRHTYSLVLPDDVVPDSDRAIFDVTGNVIGPAINNLDNLVSLPTGCGEQNLVKFTPNYLVLNYLSGIGQLTDTIESKAKMNLRKGYQRELNYRHKDGSFSAFGETDKEGSMFLTAFVLRSFYEAKKYIFIDDSVIIDCQKWIVSKQQPDGCFPNVGYIIDRGIQGGLEKEKNSGAITAYVLAALVISNYENRTVMDNAMSCLSKYPPGIPYDACLYAYTEALNGRIEAAKKLIDDISPFANKTDGVEYYNNPNGTQSIDLETVAYCVLAKLQSGESTSDVLDNVRYMSQHLNPNGGFYSTQDTCVGLDALSKFAKIVYADPVDIAVTYSGILDGMKEINEDNKMLVQRSYIYDLPGDLNVEGSGSGCALIQISLRYNTKNPPRKMSYYLEAVGECANPDCKRATIRIITNYITGEAGMTLVEIKMVTGYVPNKESIDNLKADKNNDILRVDVEDNTVIMYFEKMTTKVEDVSFGCDKIAEVDGAQPATCKVYDYYHPERTASTSYSFGNSDMSESSPGSESTEP